MSEYLHRAQNLQTAIRRVLIQEWDPICVGGIAEAQDEYDSYIGDIHAMLIRREPKQKLVDYLWWAETEHMGLYGNRNRTAAIADQLLSLIPMD